MQQLKPAKPEISDPKRPNKFAALTRNFGHPTRTAVAAVLSLLAARVIGLPEIFWAPISTMIVTQSNLGTGLTVSWQRWVGTALGSAAGALLVIWFGPNVTAYGAGLFCVGVFCVAVGLDKPAFRFAGIALTVVMFVSHTESPWVVAIHRFIEVSVGIMVGLLVLAVWPETETAQIVIQATDPGGSTESKPETPK
jgi:uncharacterized membrane protein YccC